MKRWRDLLLIVALFGILIVFTIFGPGRNQPDEIGQIGSTHVSGSQGALGLQRWLQELGYRAENLEYTEWQLPDEAAVLFMLAPRAEPVTDEQAAETLRWVRDGGTLILAQPEPTGLLKQNRVLDQLNASVVVADAAELVERADAAQPLLDTPPVASVPVRTEAVLELRRDDFVPLLSTKQGDTLVGIQEGQGYVYLASTVAPFLNDGLRDAGSAPLILNLLRRVPPGAAILFDEYHHGYHSPPTLRRAALSQGWGWPAIYAVLVIAAYIALTGRRFGRAVPLASDVARRSAAEYVQSMALLFHRSGKQDYVRDHYRRELKRRLARPYGFVPPDDDRAFVRELQRYGGADDEQAARLEKLLDQLAHSLTEEQLVRLVHAADAIADQRGRLR